MSEHVFRTLYFPSDRTRKGSSCRVTISIPAVDSAKWPISLLEFARNLSGRDLRMALGDPTFEDLVGVSERDGRSLSNTCLAILQEKFFSHELANTIGSDQMSLPIELKGRRVIAHRARPIDEIHASPVGFRESKSHRVHSWYPYVEGFSAPYVRDVLLRAGSKPVNVYDPFGGAGTTQLTAACLGIPSYYSEVNPFMVFVTEVKLRSSHWARLHLGAFNDAVEGYLSEIQSPRFLDRAAAQSLDTYNAAFPQRDFFDPGDLRQLLTCLQIANETPGPAPVRDIFRLAVAANVVHCSHMTRRADLRRRRDDEYKTRVVDVVSAVSATMRQVQSDVAELPPDMAATEFVSPDCRTIPGKYAGRFDLIITSPPYLNGTNYFRNTKLELWILGFISSELALGELCKRAIAAGINNVTRDRPPAIVPRSVEDVASELEGCAEDRRIPAMIRHYFHDMAGMFIQLRKGLKPGGQIYLDIGDSKFYGVHVPTDRLLIEVAEAAGLQLEADNLIAHRQSRDKSALVQKELVFLKPRSGG